MDLDRDSSLTQTSLPAYNNNGFEAFSSVAAQQQQHQHQHQQQQQQHQLPPPPQQGAMFGLIAASAPVRTDFVPVDAGSNNNNTKFTLTVTSPGDLPSPLTAINELVFFLLPGAANALPPNSGVLIYWQVEVSPTIQSGFELLGSLTSDRTSDIFRTGWSEREEFIGLDQSLYQSVVKINIGISIEPMDVVRNLTGDGIGTLSSTTNTNYNNNNTSSPSPMSLSSSQIAANPTPVGVVDKRPIVAQKIAQDLYNFMLSFDTGGATGNQTMTVPANIFDRWWRRFENKLRRDPNFFLKNSD